MVLLEVGSLMFLLTVFCMLCLIDSVLPTRRHSLELRNYESSIPYAMTSVFVFLLLCLTNITSFMKTEVSQVITFSIIYLIIGGLWSFFQWYVLLKDYKKYFTEFRDTWLKDKKYTLEDITTLAHKKEEWEKHRECYCREFPTWKGYRHIIAVWIIYWPILIVDYVLSLLLYDLTQFIIKQFSSLYEMICKKVFRDVEGL